MRAGNQCEVSKIDQVLAIERDHSATQRRRYSRQLQEELEYIRTRHGKSNSLKEKLKIIPGYLKPFWVYQVSMVKFILHYVRGGLFNVDLATGLWSELIKCNNFVVASYRRFLIEIIPWINRRFSKNWFILINEAPG